MNSVFSRTFTLASLVLVGLTTTASAFVYVVKEKDSLSKIAHKHFAGPVWRKNGSLEKILSANPKIENPGLIFPGDEIEIPSENTIASGGEPAVEKEPVTDQKIANDREIVIDRKIAADSGAPGDGSQTSLELIPSLAMTTLSATDSLSGGKSTVASSLYLGVDARFAQTWSDSFRSYLRAKLSYVSFDDPTSGTKSLSSKTKFLTTFGIGGVTRLSSRLTLGLSADLEKNLFVRAASTTSIVVDSVLLPSVGAKLSYDLVQMNAFTVSASGVYEHKFQGKTDSYTVRQGALYGGTIGVSRKIRGEDMFQVDLGGFKRSQNTSATTQSESIYTLSLKIPFSSGDSGGQK